MIGFHRLMFALPYNLITIVSSQKQRFFWQGSGFVIGREPALKRKLIFNSTLLLFTEKNFMNTFTHNSVYTWKIHNRSLFYETNTTKTLSKKKMSSTSIEKHIVGKMSIAWTAKHIFVGSVAVAGAA